MFAKSVTMPLFASPVWGFDLPEAEIEPINRALFDDIDRWLSPRPAIPAGETWQTTQDLHERDSFAPLYPFVDAAVQATLKALGIDEPTYEITGCWANVNPPGSAHPPHSHPNNLVSGVYYVKTTGPDDGIVFHDPRPQVHVIRPVSSRPVPDIQASISVEAKPGRLLLFPSWLRHSVHPNRSDVERVSLSFNAMLSDYVTRHARPKWRGFREDGTRS